MLSKYILILYLYQQLSKQIWGLIIMMLWKNHKKLGLNSLMIHAFGSDHPITGGGEMMETCPSPCLAQTLCDACQAKMLSTTYSLICVYIYTHIYIYIDMIYPFENWPWTVEGFRD